MAKYTYYNPDGSPVSITAETATRAAEIAKSMGVLATKPITPSPLPPPLPKEAIPQAITPTPAPTPTTLPTPTPVPTYTGVSIVDYLKSVGQPSDYASRAALAQQYGITNYTGTSAQNTQLLNLLRGTAVMPTPTPTPAPTPTPTPTTTTELAAGVVEPFVPPTPTAPSITDTYTQSMLDILEQQRRTLEQAYATQLANVQKQLEEAQTRQQEFLATQKGILEEEVKPLLEPFRADIEKSERARLKVEENYFANQQLTNELETLLTNIQADLLREREITGLASIRQPRIEKATEEATARVGVIEAVMAARNNQITVANNLIDRTVTAMTADRQDQLTYYNALLSFYDKQVDIEGNKILTLTAQEQGWIKSQIGLLESDLASTQANVDYIRGLMLDPNYASIMAGSGVTLNDTPAQVQAKFAAYSYQQEVIQQKNTAETQGYSFITPEVAATKPANEVQTITDSKGVLRHYWRETEPDILSVAEAKALGVPYGTTRQQAVAMGITPAEEAPTAPDAYKIYELSGGQTGTGMDFNSWYQQVYKGGELVTPRTWSDDEIRAKIRQMQTDELEYQTALDEIALSITLLNKDRAREIVDEMYGIKTETGKPPLPLSEGPLKITPQKILFPQVGIIDVFNLFK